MKLFLLYIYIIIKNIKFCFYNNNNNIPLLNYVIIKQPIIRECIYRNHHKK